ncbi:hypothetical protein [Bradyrhizobium yuanmingense]|uniref:hypothetical protein n=1 Tax=Bradyrhizobium yuanmingense TaxID=108015 RepID=UPI003F7D4519
MEPTFKYGVLKVVLPKTEEAQEGSQDHQRQGGLRLRWGEAVPPASLILQVPSIGEGAFHAYTSYREQRPPLVTPHTTIQRAANILLWIHVSAPASRQRR